MDTQMDPRYLVQLEAAREDVFRVGRKLVEERIGFFAWKSHSVRRALDSYNANVAEHDAIIDGIVGEHWGDFSEESEAWQNGPDGEAFNHWMQSLEAAKIGEIDTADVRKRHLHIVCGPNDVDDIPVDFEPAQLP